MIYKSFVHVLALQPCFFVFIFSNLFFLLPLFQFSPIYASSSIRCHEHESTALLQFKESFVITDMCDSIDLVEYPKTESWSHDAEQSDCCSWDGVKCDDITGHVIGLDIGHSCLSGSINSNSSLFQLVHLRSLNLAYNYFQNSLIPSAIGHLSELTHLNLSFSAFSGQIPTNISDLSKLSSLDLSWNKQLEFKNMDFETLVRNLASLEILHLDSANVSSTVPDILANSTSLVSLSLMDCSLHDEFPNGIFHLPKVEIIYLDSNIHLAGHFPQFRSSSPLRELSLHKTNFTGELHPSIGNLKSLTYLDLSYLNIMGEIPSFLANLTNLSYLDLSRNQLTGPLPCWLANLTQLAMFSVTLNELQGVIPRSIFSKLYNLEKLHLAYNNFNGPVEFDMFLALKKLRGLSLTGNNLSLSINTSSNTTFPNFRILSLGSCNLSVFPDFLRHQDELRTLSLSSNKIHGKIPRWFWNVSTETLEFISLTDNFLTGFDVHPVVLPWVKATIISMENNMLQTSLPFPPPSIVGYTLSSNRFTGEIPPSICNLTSLSMLGLGDNDLSGILPPCLGNLSSNLAFLEVGRNNFGGKIPQSFPQICNLQMIDLGQNRLEGKLPRSLANCKTLEFLDVGSNHIRDVFPSWLGELPELKILLLSSNRFHGKIKAQATDTEFQNLQIVDLSQNNFTGRLPLDYFAKWMAMKQVDPDQSGYILRNMQLKPGITFYNYSYTMTITNKGTVLRYPGVLNDLVVIDLSCNSFEGIIPPEVGNLKALYSLNISNNNLRGGIPSSLENLKLLESLDLSSNKLSGQIPQQLDQLTFLSIFNVSYNHLSGPIPQGKQFGSFPNDSYLGNPELCGLPLARKCENSEDPVPPSQEDGDPSSNSSSFEFDWKPVVMGYGSGLLVGLVVGNIVVNKNPEWFARTFRLRQQRTRRVMGVRRTN